MINMNMDNRSEQGMRFVIFVAGFLLVVLCGPVALFEGWARLTGKFDPSLEPVACSVFTGIHDDRPDDGLLFPGLHDERPDWVHLQNCTINYMVIRASSDKDGANARLVAQLLGPPMEFGKTGPTPVVVKVDGALVRSKLGPDFALAFDGSGGRPGDVIFHQTEFFPDLYLQRDKADASTEHLASLFGSSIYETYRQSSPQERHKPNRFVAVLMMLVGVIASALCIIKMPSILRFANELFPYFLRIK